MKKNLFYIYLIVISGGFSSCREELPQEVNQPAITIKEGTVKNARLYFENKESLQDAYNKIRDASGKDIASYVDKFNHTTLRPIITEANESKIKSITIARINKMKLNSHLASSKNMSNIFMNNEQVMDEIDDLEEIIGDDVYASFLNSDAEIHVANEIYKYTDVGLFIVKEDQYPQLITYLENNKISDNLLLPTQLSIRKEFIELHPVSDRTPISIDQNISYYSNPYIEFTTEISGSGQSGVQNGNNTGNGTSPISEVEKYTNNLAPCNIKHGFFGNLFGENNVCIDKYENRYRVKTKVYNYDYLLVYHMGAKVKHQYKGWTGLWRKEKASEIRIGIDGVQFQYDFSNFFMTSSVRGISSIYTSGTKYLYNSDTFWTNNSLNGTLQISGFNMNNFPKILKDDIVIQQNGWAGDIVGQAISIANRKLTSDNLNKMFWDTTINELKKFWAKLGQQPPKAVTGKNNITLFKSYSEFGKALITKAYYETKLNSSIAEKTFDFGGEIKFNINSDGSVSFGPGTTLRKPTDFMVKMYGIVKRNGQWHGSKIDNTAK